MNVINKLKNVGVNTKSLDNTGEKVEKIFEGMKIVLTGTLPTLKRNDAKDMIEKEVEKLHLVLVNRQHLFWQVKKLVLNLLKQMI